MQPSTWRPRTDAEAVGAEAVLLEWLAATRHIALDGPPGLRSWAHQNPAAFRTAFAAFARIGSAIADHAAGWLLGAGLRQDDHVHWTGAPDDPCLAALAALGGVLTSDPAPPADPARATLVLARAPSWPPPPGRPPFWPPPPSGRPVRPPA